ncbi:MAG TPA: response regulator, partial [Oscillospiraceae bacterium]|nr:response regulator [Oscillospiraceae bacterium]
MRKNRHTGGESGFSILALDDDPVMTLTLQSYFQASGYRVDTENDPNRAIERVREENYDILLLDFLMSPICGDQVVEQIRRFN